MTTEEKIHIFEHSKLVSNNFTQEAVAASYVEALSALRAQQEAERNTPLKTTWETPETCPHCMEHLSRDWSFCPECGRPTDWSESDPLTPEELQKMEGEPVLVYNAYNSSYIWHVVDVISKKVIVFTDGGARMLSCYGDGWLAYRHRPEPPKGEDENE